MLGSYGTQGLGNDAVCVYVRSQKNTIFPKKKKGLSEISMGLFIQTFRRNISSIIPPQRLFLLDQTVNKLRSEDTITMKTDDPTLKPLSSFALLEMQWKLQRLAAMSGNANQLVSIFIGPMIQELNHRQKHALSTILNNTIGKTFTRLF